MSIHLFQYHLPNEIFERSAFQVRFVDVVDDDRAGRFDRFVGDVGAVETTPADVVRRAGPEEHGVEHLVPPGQDGLARRYPHDRVLTDVEDDVGVLLVAHGPHVVIPATNLHTTSINCVI